MNEFKNLGLEFSRLQIIGLVFIDELSPELLIILQYLSFVILILSVEFTAILLSGALISLLF